MRLFLIKLAAFLSPLVAIWLFLEWEIARTPNFLTQKRDLILQQGAHAGIVVLGSSFELVGIAPALFDCAGLNLAMMAQSLFFDAEIMRVYAPHFPELRLVIQGVSYASFEGQLGDSPLNQFIYAYSYIYGTRLDSSTSYWNVKNFSRVALLGQDAVIARILEGFSSHTRLRMPIDEYGWVPLGAGGGSAPNDDGGGSKLVSTFHQWMKPEHIAENVQAIENMATSLRERGVPLVLVSLPMSNVVSSHFDPARVARMQAIINDLKARFGVEYFDYTTDPRFTYKDFSDVSHLNKEGAEKVSRIINEAVIRPLHVCPAAVAAP